MRDLRKSPAPTLAAPAGSGLFVGLMRAYRAYFFFGSAGLSIPITVAMIAVTTRPPET